MMWCEVYALCDFLEFDVGKTLIVDATKKGVDWRHLPGFLGVISSQNLKYLDLWFLLISKTMDRISEIEDMSRWHYGVFDCYDSLKPGEGPREEKDQYRCCCLHTAPTKGIVSYGKSPKIRNLYCFDRDLDSEDETEGLETFRCCTHGCSLDEKRGHKVLDYHRLINKENGEWLEALSTLPENVQGEMNRRRLVETRKQTLPQRYNQNLDNV